MQCQHIHRFILFGALLAINSVGHAHHSSAIFDFTTSKTLTGTVKEFQWTNPHVWVQVVTVNAQGEQEEWGLESGSVLIMKGMLGWNRNMIKAGDKVTVRVNPSRDGKRSGMLAMITLPTGKKYELFTIPEPGKPATPILPDILPDNTAASLK